MEIAWAGYHQRHVIRVQMPAMPWGICVDELGKAIADTDFTISNDEKDLFSGTTSKDGLLSVPFSHEEHHQVDFGINNPGN